MRRESASAQFKQLCARFEYLTERIEDYRKAATDCRNLDTDPIYQKLLNEHKEVGQQLMNSWR